MDKKSGESSDFSKGSVGKNIMNMALPMTLAQLINILYNIVDRMYIGHIPDAGAMALTGRGPFVLHCQRAGEEAEGGTDYG